LTGAWQSFRRGVVEEPGKSRGSHLLERGGGRICDRKAGKRANQPSGAFLVPYSADAAPGGRLLFV